jgi:hypothetical protein
VYSFGVVMLELVTGMPAVSQDANPPQLCLRVKDYLKVRSAFVFFYLRKVNLVIRMNEPHLKVSACPAVFF